MSMISELVERLRRYARFSKTNTPSWSEAMMQAADTIEELSAKLSALQMERSSQYYHGGWIPCEERLPEITIKDMYSDKVLVALKWRNDDITHEVGWYYASGIWSCDSEICKVIAWRPLPEPYREVQDETD